MPLFTKKDYHFACTVADIAYCNPFLPRRIELERNALGADFKERDADWNVRVTREDDIPNVMVLRNLADSMLERTRKRLLRKVEHTQDERAVYDDLVLFVLYHRYRTGFDPLISSVSEPRKSQLRIAQYDAFCEDARYWLNTPDRSPVSAMELSHMFACFFQVRRAFRNIFEYIIGSSRPTVSIRAAAWQSIFTCDMRRYRRSLYHQMGDFTTLITGPSGTGKELIARAIGLSRYIPFDHDAKRPVENFQGAFTALNLSALSPTLIESELFGHKQGAFTGATSNRTGWLETCTKLGTVFLDEIGELDLAIQVKLLRVLQARRFSRLGDTALLEFKGKIIAATNRDLASEIEAGSFREDLYYRLCSDIITMPSLRDRLDDNPNELAQLIEFIARKIVDTEASELINEVTECVHAIGQDYPWPGNVRELEQCIRNVLIHGEYRPARRIEPAKATIVDQIRNAELTVDELMSYYCDLAYKKFGSMEKAAAHLGIDRRTLRAKMT